MFFSLIAAGASVVFGFPARLLGTRFRLTAGKGIAATGGLAIIAAWWSVTLPTSDLPTRLLGGLALATLPILVAGLWDLRRPLGPLPQLLAQILSAASAVGAGGVVARYVTNPAGGLLYLNQWEMFGIPLQGALLSIIWIVLLMNAVNFLDGVDGLASSVSAVGFLAIGAVSLLPQVNEPSVALPAFIAAGATLGFLFWNFPPARLYLGTPGAWFLGFLLAVLSLQGSSKIATLAVVGAIPLLDATSVALARIRRGSSPFRGDTSHLHHRLAARGWSPRTMLALYTVASVILGLAAVTLPTFAKITLVFAGGAAFILFTRRVDGKPKTP